MAGGLTMYYGNMDSNLKEMWLEVESKRENNHIIEDLCKEYGLKGKGKPVQFKRFDPTFLPKA